MAAGFTAWLIWAASVISAPIQPTVKITHHVIQDMMIVRVPVRPMVGKLAWEEKDGPRCISMRQIRGAAMAAPSSVDFIMTGGTRYRARFEKDCQALDFYGDFYIETREDDICAKRHEVRSRVGGRCTIERFDRVRLMQVR